MGLDDFMDIESDSSDSTSSKTKSTSSSNTGDVDLSSYDSFHLVNGKLARRGLVGYQTQEQFDDTVVERIEIDELLAKFWYPIFPHTELRDMVDVGERLNISVIDPSEDSKCHNVVGVTCLSVDERPLYTIPRELVMLDTGEYKKDKAMSVLSERFGTDASHDTTVKLHMFGNYMALAQTAVVNTNINDWTNKEYATLTESALRPGKLQELRRKWDDKHISELPEW